MKIIYCHIYDNPPKSYVDNGVVRLAPHGCPLVVREIVHLHRQHVNICSSQTSYMCTKIEGYQNVIS